MLDRLRERTNVQLISRLYAFQRSAMGISLISAVDSAAAFVTRFTKQHRDDAQCHLVLASSGKGNIGDRAMLEAVLARTIGPTKVIVEQSNDYERTGQFSETEFVPLPILANGYALYRFRDSLRFAALLKNATSYSVIGADVMDGLYDVALSVARSSTMVMAANAGVPTTLYGFSWSEIANPTALNSLMRAARAGASLYPRDPASLRRLTADGIDSVVQAADVVFTDRTVTTAGEQHSWIVAQRQRGHRIAIVNVSGLLARRMNQIPEYLEILTHLLQKDFSIVLLPHVLRRGDDDLAALELLEQEVLRARMPSTGMRITLVSHGSRPSDIRGLTMEADIVITGRMHLAILAMSQGTPAITLGTQGKVEGLYEMFELPALCVEPNPGFGSRVVSLLSELDLAETRSVLGDKLPSVLALAERNFDGLAEVS